MGNYLTTVLVNDTHIGHDQGLKSDTAMTEKGKKSEFANSNQEVLWEAWKEFCKKYKNPDILILNGDIPDLMSIRSREDEMWTKDAGAIRNEAVKLMKMLNAKKIYVIKGTPAHVDAEHLTLERDIARDLNAFTYQNKQLFNFALIDLAPKQAQERALYHVTHHINVTTNWYRGTAPAKATVSLMLNESHFIDRKIWKKIVGIIRGHVHHYWYEESDSRRMIINPCWEMATNWMIQKMPETPPDIGSTILQHHIDGTFDKQRYRVPVDKLRPPVFRGYEN